jgi:CRP-like cAMP-binding protein
MAPIKRVVRASTHRTALETTRIPFEVHQYQPGEVIFFQGDQADRVMYIEAGRVRMAVAAASGKEAICGLLEAGAFLGEDVLAGRTDRRETATAMTAAELLAIETSDMIRVLHSQPEIVAQFITRIIARSVQFEADLVAQLLSSSEQRLARTLLMLAGCGERPASPCVLPHVPQEILAEMVGTTRSRVNVFMGRFKKLGCIANHHGELLLAPSLLRAIRDGGVPKGTAPARPHGLALKTRRKVQREIDYCDGDCGRLDGPAGTGGGQ